MQRREARFWIFGRSVDNLVRLKIPVGGSARVVSGGRTDEGWQSEEAVYTFDGSIVTREEWTDGRDCDGRLSTHAVVACPVHLLRAHRWGEGDGGHGWPVWDLVTEDQRDYSAEAAGY